MYTLLASLLSLTAVAGDPCPIPIVLHAHTPSWRDGAADLAALTSQARLFGLTWGDGNRVLQVEPALPAEASGLRPGDRITTFDGAELRDHEHLGQLFDALTTDTVALSVLREDTPFDVRLTRTAVDPLLRSMVGVLGGLECRSAEVHTLTEAERAAIEAKAFDMHRGFRCDDAHKRLADDFDSGDLLLLRGGRRVLLIMPGWTSLCVQVADHDGALLTPERTGALLDRLTSAYVADRHNNP